MGFAVGIEGVRIPVFRWTSASFRKAFAPSTSPHPALRATSLPQGEKDERSAHIQIRIQCLAFVELHAEAVQHHRDLRVLAAGEDDIHALLLGEVGFERRPGFVADALARVEVVAGADERGIGGGPAGRVGAGFDVVDLGLSHAAAQTDAHVLASIHSRSGN